MKIRQYHQLGALEGVQQFCSTYPIESPPEGFTAQLQALSDVLVRLRGYVLAQGADGESARGEANRQRALATRIREEQMLPIRDIAFAWLKDLPELKGKFYVPRSVTGHRPLADALQVMAQSAEPHSVLFIRHGAAPDFVAKLLSSADDVQKAIADRVESAKGRAGATQGIAQQTKLGFEIVRQLEAILKPRFGKDEAAKAAWRAVRRVTQTTGRRRAKGQTPDAEASTVSSLPLQPQGVVNGPVSSEVLKAA